MQQTDRHDLLQHKAFFVTGTDTEIGKTWVAAAIAAAAEEANLPWHYFKPAESGEDADDSDGGKVRAWAGEHVTVGYHLDTPLAPLFAAEQAGMTIDMNRLDQTVDELRAVHQPFIVEGAGGLMTPYLENITALDLICRWQMPALVVSGNRLGCLNHTLLTLKALEAAGVTVPGVVFNDVGSGLSVPRNPLDFVRFSNVPVLAWLPRLPAGAKPDAAWWKAGVERAAAIRQRR